MGAKTGSRDGPVEQLDAVFGTAAGERFTVKFRAIVDEDGSGQAEHVPARFTCRGGPRTVLRQHRVLDAQRDRKRGGRLESDVETSTARVATSMASDSHGLPMDRRCCESTIMTSASVWSIWINSSAALASNMPGVDNATDSADFAPSRRRATRRASSARLRLRMLLREVGIRQGGHTAKLGDADFPKVTGTGFRNPGATAL
jgi:hypothetical protein